MILLIIVATFSILLIIFLRQPQFGKLPAGERLQRIQKSPNYKNGQFRNINPTPDLAEGTSYFTVMKYFIFNKNKRSRPESVLPSVKTNLHTLDPKKNVLVWFGHSSYFMQIDGKKILVDPVLCGYASPVNFTTRSYPGTDVYTPEDIPQIDYLFLSHDHWDHLDYKTVKELKPKVGKVITALGVGAHLERWGYEKNKVIETDWNEEVMLGNGFVVNTIPARHFSGRGLIRQKSLWISFVLRTPTLTLFIGGDSGYDSHFATAGIVYGPFDLAILECGQYDYYWKYIHMMPHEVVQATIDLKAKKLMPVHWGKFSLANHAWDDPIRQISELSKSKNIPLLTPMIGEEADLNSSSLSREWWIEVSC